jgi:CheY-like chemotaxis protein
MTKTVLLIDDNADVLFINRLAIQKYLGYSVITSENGRQGIELAAAHKPDVVLVDVIMEGFDGFETCQALKANLETASIPVIFLSAKESAEEQRKALSSGGVAFLVKDSDPLLFCKKLERIIQDESSRNGGEKASE